MDKFHQEILEELKKASGDKSQHSGNDSYLSSGHFYYYIRNPRKQLIAKQWFLKHKDLEASDFINLLDSLYKGKSYEEKTITGELLLLFPKLRRQVPIKMLVSWLGELQGWAEVDSTCQNKFTADEILSNWVEWKKLLISLSTDKNINNRRASLVFLTAPVTYSQDMRLSNLAFENIDKLKTENNILITKAISWLLRSLIKYHKKEVEDYLEKNAASLPKIAVRETKRKLITGKK